MPLVPVMVIVALPVLVCFFVESVSTDVPDWLTVVRLKLAVTNFGSAATRCAIAVDGERSNHRNGGKQVV